MSERKIKAQNASRRAARTRATILGTAERPRLSVNISNMHVSAQIINDEEHVTLVAATTVGSKASGTMIEKASVVGKNIATLAKKKNITKVVFDRGSKQYHGRVKALADAARENGLEF
jgi:large subunit ribosomal protein L18